MECGLGLGSKLHLGLQLGLVLGLISELQLGLALAFELTGVINEAETFFKKEKPTRLFIND